MKLEKYIDGLDMEQFEHIPSISHYGYNYYEGLEGNLLFGLSDDDNTTEWWVIVGQNSYYIGESYCSDSEKLYRYESRRT